MTKGEGMEDKRSVRREKLGDRSQHNPLMHMHEGLELVRVDEGSMDMVVEGRENLLGEGDVILINRGRMHQAREAGAAGCRYSVLSLDPAALTRDEEVYARYIEPILSDERLDCLVDEDCAGSSGEVCRLMERIAELERERPAAYELEVIALTHLVFKQVYLAMRSHAQASASPAATNDALLQRRMTDYIYEHFSEKIGLDDIAAAGGVSRSKCSNVFREQLGSSPVEFLNAYRLEAAAKKLALTDDTVAKVALECGFSQQSYFNRVFMKAYGCTPRQYRLSSRAA